MRWLCAVLILFAGLRVAAADIRIDESRYENGQTVIVGETEPGRTLTLDGKFKTKSDGEGRFKFTVKYKPATCMSDIRTGEEVYSAVIAGCLDPGVAIDRLPANKTAGKPQH